MRAQNLYEVARLEHILSHRADCETVSVAALTVYFDDSGTHSTAPVAVVAGWISPVLQWKRFTREWKKAGLEYGFKEFHMAEFMANNPKSEFADTRKWNDAYKARVLRRLCSIISQHTLYGLCTGVIKQDYDDLVPPEVREDIGQYHYSCAVRGAIGFMEKWRIKNTITEPTEFIFDYMTKGPEKAEIERVFEEANLLDGKGQKYGMYPGCHSFRSRKDILPLQASDVLAWMSQRVHAAERTGKLMPQFAADEWNKFLTSGKIDAKYQTRQQLAQFVQDLKKGNPEWKREMAKRKAKAKEQIG